MKKLPLILLRMGGFGVPGREASTLFMTMLFCYDQKSIQIFK